MSGRTGREALARPGAARALWLSLRAGWAKSVDPESGGSRQVSTTMLVQPRRGVGIAAKVLVVQVWVVICAVVASAATLAVSVHAMGHYAPSLAPLPWSRLAGVVVWWSVAAMGAFMLATLTRGAMVPLVWSIATMTLVSPSLLAWRATGSTAITWMPDFAGPALVIGGQYRSAGLEMPAPGPAWQHALACALWWGACTAVSATAWVRRDA